MKKKYLVVIAGPTAVGKTALSILVSKRLNAEIISADSRQFFREMNLGTAKPAEEELRSIQHHFINNLSIHDDYDAGKFEKEALDKIESLHQQSDYVVMVGGSGLYVNAVCNGFDLMPEIKEGLREQLNDQLKEKGLASLNDTLKDLDPEYFEIVDRNNPQRIIRALEVCLSTGHPYSTYRVKRKVERPFQTLKIGLELPRSELYTRIDDRMDDMIKNGLFEEAKLLYPHRALNSLQTVGYTEIFDFMDGNYDRDEAVRLLKRNSRRYAKRQMTWFKKDPEMNWFNPDQYDEIVDLIKTLAGVSD
ncbi:MAG: tRNA (adenosine(37)-N6)-dimethylallyltransferase MiaA [Bacteroidota bacterium]